MSSFSSTPYRGAPASPQEHWIFFLSLTPVTSIVPSVDKFHSFYRTGNLSLTMVPDPGWSKHMIHWVTGSREDKRTIYSSLFLNFCWNIYPRSLKFENQGHHPGSKDPLIPGQRAELYQLCLCILLWNGHCRWVVTAVVLCNICVSVAFLIHWDTGERSHQLKWLWVYTLHSSAKVDTHRTPQILVLVRLLVLVLFSGFYSSFQTKLCLQKAP